MITAENIIELVHGGLPEAQVEAMDTMGDAAHWRVVVISERFEGMGRLDRHRLVMQQLQPSLGDGKPIHAVEIKPLAPSELS